MQSAITAIAIQRTTPTTLMTILLTQAITILPITLHMIASVVVDVAIAIVVATAIVGTVKIVNQLFLKMMC